MVAWVLPLTLLHLASGLKRPETNFRQISEFLSESLKRFSLRLCVPMLPYSIMPSTLWFWAFDIKCYDDNIKNIFKGLSSDTLHIHAVLGCPTYRKIISFSSNFFIFSYSSTHFIVNLLQINLTLIHLVTIYVVTCWVELFIPIQISLNLLSCFVGDIFQWSHRRATVTQQ